jgi:hypothetical protein
MKKTLLIFMLGVFGMSLFAQTEFEVKFKDLPKETQKYIQKNFDGYKIDKAVQGENTKGKMTSCEVFVSKGAEKFRLIFDKDGEFVKKEIVTEQPKAPAATVAPAAPAAAPPAAAADTTKKKK